MNSSEIFFISSHKRLRVELTEELRTMVRDTAIELRKIRESFTIPAAQYSSKCKKCSMLEYCMPKVKKSASEYCNDKGRRKVLNAWQKRKQETIRHPFLDEKIEIGMLPYAQAMLFARVLRGDLDEYPPYSWR
ncbi:MAG: Dna2/Cas4 domain-containing protein [Eubacteriales bacterium]|nr:Dna2/Cas4 domain-containing protein [Eubacteriales bacterium]